MLLNMFFVDLAQVTRSDLMTLTIGNLPPATGVSVKLVYVTELTVGM